MSEYVYVRFTYDNYGYEAGDVVKVWFIAREDYWVRVKFFEDGAPRGGYTAWSDLGSFQEISDMEVIAHCANGGEIL